MVSHYPKHKIIRNKARHEKRHGTFPKFLEPPWVYLLGRKVYCFRELERGKGSKTKKVSVGEIMWNMLFLNVETDQFRASWKRQAWFQVVREWGLDCSQIALISCLKKKVLKHSHSSIKQLDVESLCLFGKTLLDLCRLLNPTSGGQLILRENKWQKFLVLFTYS